MTTMVSLRRGHDVRYFTNHGGAGGCAGAMAYYTKAGEPPGQWAGRGAVKLGLTGQVDPQVLDRLFMDNVGPDGEVLARRHQAHGDEVAEQREVRAWRRKHPYASAAELGEFRAGLRAKASQRKRAVFRPDDLGGQVACRCCTPLTGSRRCRRAGQAAPPVPMHWMRAPTRSRVH